ncbi:MAG: PCMD domain-containing protein [Bacteroides sp.]|nr:PCMD domain-containing protein [Bacteroides sp.]
MKRSHIYIPSLLLGWLMTILCGCIENDLGYPSIPVEITKFSVRGQIGNAIINNETRTVTVTVADTVYLKRVYLREIEMTEGATGPLEAGMLLDLSDSRKVTLELYQEYEWTIKAQQTIECEFKIAGDFIQVGEPEFYPGEYYAVARVTDKVALEDLTVERLKLGPTGSTINMSTEVPPIDWEYLGNYCKAKVVVNYSDFIVMEEWTLYIFQTDVTVSTKQADAWVNVAWLYGEGLAGADNGFEIREVTEEEWTVVDASYVTHSGGNFSACVPHLKEKTGYVCRAYSNGEYGAEISFTTGEAVTLPGGTFDNWHKAGDIWYPYAQDETPFWDSGNKGATTVGESNTVPTSDIWSGKNEGQAAYLESKFVGALGFGKFAAGNLFVGEFIDTDGTNGILDFGKPFTARPTKLRGYYKYKTGAMDYASGDFADFKGRPDTCHIYVAVGDWDEPVRIRTKPANRKLFDVNDPNIIAYAELSSGVNVPDYRAFELVLDYRATDQVPTYLVIVCTASKYGDYFVGSTSSELYIDEFSLEYDY